MQNLWIWQHTNYPNFSFDKREIDTIINKLEQDHKILKELKRSSIRSSAKKRLDENFDWLADTHATRHSDNLVSLILEANLNKAPMNFERLHDWHNACLDIAIAKFTR